MYIRRFKYKAKDVDCKYCTEYRGKNKCPHPIREDSRKVLPKNHLCFGCKRQGESCTHPCHREVRQNRNLEVAVCGL